MKELDRRSKLGVRNIKISPLFEKGKIYNIDNRGTDEYGKEDPNGTLAPEINHCWVNWESKWKDADGNFHWSREAYDFKSLDEAAEAKTYLEKRLV